MPLNGAKPKAGPVRHRNPTYQFTEVAAVPYEGEVPLDPDPEWHLLTLRWWNTVTRMPHCVLWESSDWETAWHCASMRDIWNKRHTAAVLPEIRQMEKELGTTWAARLGQRIRYVDQSGSEVEGDNVIALKR